jgi:hypothetical protein
MDIAHEMARAWYPAASLHAQPHPSASLTPAAGAPEKSLDFLGWLTDGGRLNELSLFITEEKEYQTVNNINKHLVLPFSRQ